MNRRHFRLPWRWIWVVLAGVLALYSLRPAEDSIRVFKLEVTDQLMDPQNPGSRVMKVDRRIFRDFWGWYTVEEWLMLREGRRLRVKSCEAERLIHYQPNSELPVPVTAEWSAWGDCGGVRPAYPVGPGQYQLCTTHHVAILPLIPIFTRATHEVCSQPYQGPVLVAMK